MPKKPSLYATLWQLLPKFRCSRVTHYIGAIPPPVVRDMCHKLIRSSRELKANLKTNVWWRAKKRSTESISILVWLSNHFRGSIYGRLVGSSCQHIYMHSRRLVTTEPTTVQYDLTSTESASIVSAEYIIEKGNTYFYIFRYAYYTQKMVI